MLSPHWSESGARAGPYDLKRRAVGALLTPPAGVVALDCRAAMELALTAQIG